MKFKNTENSAHCFLQTSYYELTLFVEVMSMDKFIIFDIIKGKIMRVAVNIFITSIIILYLSFPFNSTLFGQSGFSGRDQLLEAFKNSNTVEIHNYLGNYVTLHIGDDTGVYTDQQSVSILGRFFKEHPPQRVTFVKEGKSNLNYFCIARYSSKGINWRVYILFYNSDNKYTIKQIDIEKE